MNISFLETTSISALFSSIQRQNRVTNSSNPISFNSLSKAELVNMSNEPRYPEKNIVGEPYYE